MNIVDHVEWNSRLRGQSIAVRWEGLSLSYETLDLQASGLANFMAKTGIVPGDRVALVLPNCPAFIALYLGTLKLGAVVVPINPSLTSDELARLIVDCEPCLIFSNTSVGPYCEAALEGNTSTQLRIIDEVVSPEETASQMRPALDCASSDLAVIAYTSGTTGVPKGVMLSHGNVVSNCEAKRTHLGLTEKDRLLLFLPLFHCFGQNAIMNAAFQSGAAVVLHSGLVVDRLVKSIREDSVTAFFAVPAGFALLLDTPVDVMRGVRFFFSAAAPLSPEIEAAWRERFGQTILQGYGLTETSPFAAFNHRVQHRAGSIGSPIEGVQMRIVDAHTGDPVPDGEQGEILIKGPNVMLGYWRKEEDTRASLKKGWFYSGDIGRRDGDGYFYYEDRSKDMINMAGQKIFPAEIEKVIRIHPDVTDVAVVGLPDRLVGEVAVAFVVPKPGSTPDADAIVDFCRDKLAAYKLPGAVQFEKELPRSPSGKILKRLLRDKAITEPESSEEPREPTVAVEPTEAPEMLGADSIEKWICDWLQQRMYGSADTSSIDPVRTFASQAISSLDLVIMMGDLGNEVKMDLAPSLPWSCPSARELARQVHTLVEAEHAGAEDDWDLEPSNSEKFARDS